MSSSQSDDRLNSSKEAGPQPSPNEGILYVQFKDDCMLFVTPDPAFTIDIIEKYAGGYYMKGDSALAFLKTPAAVQALKPLSIFVVEDVLPDMNAIEFLNKAQRISAFSHLPFVVFTDWYRSMVVGNEVWADNQKVLVLDRDKSYVSKMSKIFKDRVVESRNLEQAKDTVEKYDLKLVIADFALLQNNITAEPFVQLLQENRITVLLTVSSVADMTPESLAMQLAEMCISKPYFSVHGKLLEELR